MGSVTALGYSQANTVEAEPVLLFTLQFIAWGSSEGSSSSWYGIDSSTVYTG